MPPSSRKRNKGKERKAKQAVKRQDNEHRTRGHKMWRYLESGKVGFCNHGYNGALSDNHPVSKFMDTFFTDWTQKNIEENLRNTYQTHKRVWDDSSLRELVMAAMFRVGTNMLLDKRSLSWAACVAEAIVVLDQYTYTSDIESAIWSRSVLKKCREYESGASSKLRDVLKFYRKRLSCSCLKIEYLEARKHIPKMGVCYGCRKEKERASLDVCSRCMIQQYCSRECQVADWPVHLSKCDRYVKAHTIRLK